MEVAALKVAVIGGGSFGTALAKIFSENLGHCSWWMHNSDSALHVMRYHHNPRYLSSVGFQPDTISVYTDVSDCVKEADIIVLAVPSAFIKEVLADLSPELLKNKIIATTIKGIIPDENMIVGRYLNEVLGVPEEQIVVITGPCHAEEIALERLSFLTVAARDKKVAKMMVNCLECHYVRCTWSADLYGTEYAAVMKNIYAIAAGIYHGLGYGDNFQAVLMSNSVREMKRFMNAVSDTKVNIYKSAYLGDLLVTGYSQFSRNRMLGNMLGKGYTVRSARAEMTMVAEGYYAVPLVYKLRKKREVKMPIVKAVHSVLYEGKPARKVMAKLAQKLS
ncbi:MAG: NAD(P)H-dependent glycerol-3-phosphate dehydrogenase [Schleiferiaceae bacterium]|jgi:glycerol-3-phosphate dehydrogenase (NAD(P)+)|nr:NAD(P)H-dependent glycerol-3-phosphate dehydrogenase [Schleiferiaceae bacterium]MDA8819856.1 NAD(P)H-dependent glycerol-3-phosphate dehydrogenase [Schleiferiaceae bacterium]